MTDGPISRSASAPSRRRLLGAALPALGTAFLLNSRPRPAYASPDSPRPSQKTTASSSPGVSATVYDGAAEALADIGAAWYYNWQASTGDIAKPEHVEFVPMIWGAKSVTDDDLDHARQEGKQLLGFNEPDLESQANMSVEDALSLWPKLQDTGLRLGAPAVAVDGDRDGSWLDRFLSGAADRGHRVDFVPLHWYGGDFGAQAADQLKDYLTAVHDRYGKPIWLTEYALIDFSGDEPRYPSEKEQTDFVHSAAAMLRQLPFVERHAWFTLSTGASPTGLYDGDKRNATGNAFHDEVGA